MKLFSVSTRLKKFDGHEDVGLDWFYDDKRHALRPYAELVEDYDSRNVMAQYNEAHIDELFDEDEAKQLLAYLERAHGDDGVSKIKEVKLPAPNNAMALCAIPVGGLQGFYQLHKQKHYDLPFKVEGYYDLRHCEMCSEVAQA
jgi:hypothetical protein